MHVAGNNFKFNDPVFAGGTISQSPWSAVMMQWDGIHGSYNLNLVDPIISSSTSPVSIGFSLSNGCRIKHRGLNLYGALSYLYLIQNGGSAEEWITKVGTGTVTIHPSSTGSVSSGVAARPTAPIEMQGPLTVGLSLR